MSTIYTNTDADVNEVYSVSNPFEESFNGRYRTASFDVRVVDDDLQAIMQRVTIQMDEDGTSPMRWDDRELNLDDIVIAIRAELAIKSAAAQLGRKGGSARTAAKAAASAANGKKGGRPVDPNSARQRKLKAKE